MRKKGQLTLPMLIGSTLSLVVLGLILTIGQDIQAEMRSGQDNTGYLWNSSIDSAQGIDKISNWQKTIGLVIGAGAVITIVVLSFAVIRTR